LGIASNSTIKDYVTKSPEFYTLWENQRFQQTLKVMNMDDGTKLYEIIDAIL